MATEATHRKQRKRPTGITILALLGFIGGTFVILGGIAFFALGFFVAGGGHVVSGGGYVVSGGGYVLLGASLLPIGVVALVLGYGYWTLKPWAWPLGIGLQIAGLVVDVISIVQGTFVGSECLSIIISVIVLSYLTGPEVRQVFRREPQPPGYPPSDSPPSAPAPYGGYAPPSGYGQPGGYGQYAPPSYPMAPGYPPPGYPPSGYPPQPPEGTYPQPGAYPPPPPSGYPPPWVPLTQPETGGGFALAGLILGIVSIPIALFAICGYITSILGIIFSMLGLRAPAKRTMATIGIVVSVLGFIASIASSVVGVMIQQHQYSITGSGSTFATATATATATTAPTPTAVRTVVYQNTFAANADGWTQNSHCFEGAGGYHIANDSACYAPIGAQTDVDISVKAKQLTGSTAHPFGIVFGRDDAHIEYRFMIDSSGTWVLDSCTATTCGLVMDGGYAGRGGGVDNTLEVHVKGKRFNLDVNGERVYYNYDSASYTGGRIGLAVSGATEVVFSDLVVTRIG